MTISTDPNTIFSVDEAINAFRSWASAELLNNQLRWLVAESRKQNRKKSEILRRVLVAWINRHPEAHVTKHSLRVGAMENAIQPAVAMRRHHN
jgi:hypothetical protein